MKKLTLLLSILGFVVIVPIMTSAQMGMMGSGYWQNNNNGTQLPQSAELKGVLQDIYEMQNIDNGAKIDCSKVTDNQFEKLGDSYMGIMLPNENQHQVMDNMMGGEGSQSLTQAHINMGRSYLGCWSNYNSGPVFMPMMGGVIGNYGSYGNNGMMGWSGMMGFGGYNWITPVLLWVLLGLGIAVAVKWLRKK